MRFAQEAGRELRFRGSAEDRWLEDLVDYAAAFDPDVPARLRPATPEQIAELERRCGQPLPRSYRRFLEVMGANQGGILADYKVHLDIDEVLELYDDLPQRPENAIPIGRGIMGYCDQLSLKPMPEGEPQVVFSDEEWVGSPIARSLPRLLLQQAFFRYELGSYPVRQQYGLQKQLHTLQRCERAATAAGFARYWFSDGYNLCGWAEGAALGAHQPQGGPGWLTVGGVDAEVCARLSDALDATLGMSFQKKLVELPE
ncbi:MAG: SMI1/KNR4 family protein [Planctomycetota bacterium]